MLQQIIQQIKDIHGFRFYFIISVLFAIFLVITFKEEIRHFEFNAEELNEVKDKEGLIIALKRLKHEHKLVNGYIFYIYQPTKNSYYKRLVDTDIPFIEQHEYFKGMPLNTQKYLNYLLIDNEYVLLSYKKKEEQDYIETYASDYVYVYNVKMNETIAEVILTFDVEPSEQELQLISKKLKTIKFYLM